MRKVILIEENQVLNDLLSINLINILGVELIKLKNVEDFSKHLKILHEMDLIICSDQEKERIQNLITEKNLKISLIILGGSEAFDDGFIHTVLNPQEHWETAITLAAKILGITDEVLEKKATPDYVPIAINYFLNLESVNCDVFIRIKKTPIEYQLVKRLHHGDSFTKDTINHYKDLGLEYFYIPKDQHAIFTAFLSKQLIKKLDTPDLEMNKKLEIMGESYDFVTKEILSLGLTPEVVELTDSIINNMVKNVEQSPAMTSLLSKVINAQTPLGFQRCHMTTAIATECLKNLMMNLDNSTLDFTFASFFHDITLADHLELSLINSKSELAEANLSDEQRDLVLNHAVEAAALIYKYPNVPKGVEDLIMQHHGVEHGLGFNNNIEDLSMTSQIFIIAHDFVLEILKYKEHKTIPHSISADLHKKFPSSTCTKIINALEQSLIKKKKII